MRLSPLIGLAVALAVGGCGPPTPDRERMQTLAGVALSDPLRYGGPLDAWVNYYRSPIPNQMAVRTEGDGPKRYLWVYPL